MSGAAVMETGKANLDVFSETLLALARKNRNILVVTSDSRGSGKLVPFAQALPGQIIEVGIAEQNLVGIAAGLASAGKIVFAVSPGSFLTARSLEQIKNDVCYSDHPVKLVGISSGVSYGALGSTHHSLHDLAVLRAIPNCTIVVPADNLETAEAVKAAAEMPHPVFLRFGKRPMPPLHRPGTKFTVGKALLVRDGSDIAFLATGETVVQAAGACDLLAREGISARVLSMHTVKPLDEEAVLRAARECGAVVTVEEHSCAGGLGEACAAVLMQAGVSVPFRIVGFPDEDTVTGSQLDIMAYYGISPEGLAEIGRALLNRKRV
ncbi:MAG TPA: transketolase C-terminal domain-containing protein [Anaerohalosphaeraceae bacterium]|nr:transketolase C-terminal domain-containing protein [Anaerohalosphaeraceae bacterium]